MKIKINNILKEMIKLFVFILQNTKDFNSQIKLLKQKQEIIERLEIIIKKYDEIINENYI